MSEYAPCSGSVIGLHDADAKGDCRWCGRKRVSQPAPRPERFERRGEDDPRRMAELNEETGWPYE